MLGKATDPTTAGTAGSCNPILHVWNAGQGKLVYFFVTPLTGPHACLGAQLARIEMAEVLSVLAQRIATWELAGEVTHMPMSSNGNRTSLPVTFTVRS